MNQTLIDNLRYVLQNMRLQKGEMAKVQADIVSQSIEEIKTLDCKIIAMKERIRELEDVTEERVE